MKVLITGGTGFIGSHLTRLFSKEGHVVVAIGTRPHFLGLLPENVTYLRADTTLTGDWQDIAATADLVINLAGKSIFHRWSRKYKKQLYDSRILTTRNLVQAMAGNQGRTLISTSAVGYYGNGGENELTEDSPGGRDFLATLSRDWEAEALAAQTKAIRVAIARFGIVLGREGGALHTMLSAYKSYVGGPLGSGKQWVPWIHIEDIVAAMAFLADHTDLSGPFNVCAPHPERNKDMSAMIGAALGRPSRVAAPALALKMVMGELADALLASQRVIPRRLLAAGFQFAQPHLKEALHDLLK